MSDLRKAAQDALEYLNAPSAKLWPAGAQHRIITALRAALAHPEPEPEPEPVAYLWQHGETGRTRIIEKDQVWTSSNQWNRVGPLYLHPPQRKPLTEEQIEYLAPVSFTWRDMVTFARAIEAAHGIGGEE